MEIQRIDAGTIALVGLSRFFCELLHQISSVADPTGHPSVERRLYPPPAEDPTPAFVKDWHDYVEPDLRQLFKSALDVVTDDLTRLQPGSAPDEYTLELPLPHLESWLNALNQARLALAARHEFTERQLEAYPPVNDARAFALFQIHTYGLLQEWFLRELENS